MLRSFRKIALGLAVLLGTAAAHAPARADGFYVLPIAAQQVSETARTERLEISTQLNAWKTAWSREGARSQFAGLESVYASGEALRTLALSSGFKGWQIDWMQVDFIQITGDRATSSSSVLLAGVGGNRVMHVWHKDASGWRIIIEQILTPKAAF